MSGVVSILATASDDVGVAGVQFQIDSVNLGPQDVTTPYGVDWDTRTAANGTHAITVIARDAAGHASTSTISVIVSNAPPVSVPNVVNLTQAAATTAITGAGLTVGTVTTASSSTVAAGSVISESPVSGTQVALGSAVSLLVSTGSSALGVDKVAFSDGTGTRTISGFSTVAAGRSWWPSPPRTARRRARRR